MHIDVVSDVTCPWCFIGKRRLERALSRRPDVMTTLSWRAFELNPDLPSDGIPRELYLSAKFGSRRTAERFYAAISAAGRTEGVEFAFDRIRRAPNTLRAHRLIYLAGGKGCAERVVEALFRAYFLEGLDIGRVEILTDLAARADLDAAETREFLAGDSGTCEVDRKSTRLNSSHYQPSRMPSSA